MLCYNDCPDYMYATSVLTKLDAVDVRHFFHGKGLCVGEMAGLDRNFHESCSRRQISNAFVEADGSVRKQDTACRCRYSAQINDVYRYLSANEWAAMNPARTWACRRRPELRGRRHIDLQ